MKKYIINFILLTVIIILYGCNKTSNTVKIGILFPMTGNSGEYGVKGKRAIDLAVDQINNAGGIKGKKIEAIIEDSQADPRIGVTAIQKLINIDRVTCVVGGIVSAVTIPAAAIAEKNGIVMIAPTSSAPAITKAGKFIYRVWPSDLAEGSAAGEYAKLEGFKRAAIIHLNNDYGNQIADIFTQAFTTKSQKVISNESYLPQNYDYRTILTKIKALKPDVIYIAGYYEDSATIIKQAKQLSINVQFIGATAIEDQKFLQLAGKSAEGVVFPTAAGFDVHLKDSVTSKFVNAFETKYNYEPNWVESYCYDAFMLIINAMRSTGREDGESIRKYLDNMGIYHGVTGEIKFDINGDVIKKIIYRTVKNGKFENLN